jgi:cyclohexanone monooxygenase
MSANTDVTRLDVAIIGAGFSGLYMLHRFRQMGLRTHVYDSADGVGGTWYWNRYPGCGSDIEAVEYSYSFSEELQQEWKWKHRYPSQVELDQYLNHVAERFDLMRDISLNTYISSVHWNAADKRWDIATSTGEKISAQFCVMATGLISAPKKIDIPGYEDFAGETLHTFDWPREKPDFAGKRVGVIGTGSSAIQAIPIIAREAGELFVFQRTPHFVVPLNNGPLDPDYERRVKSDYKGWRQKQMNSFGGYISLNFEAGVPNTRSAMEVTPEERRAEYETRWKSGGLCFYTSFKDLLLSDEANETLAEFFREKTRARIKDPELAEKLIPQGYPILTKRLCADTGYFETYERENVHLVSVKENAIERITPAGIKLADGTEYPLDVLIFATGFDAITGVLTTMDIKGRDGLTFSEAWYDGPRTYMGITTSGFPNMFVVNGPGSCTGFFNPVLNVEYQGNWLAELIGHMRAAGTQVVESTREADDGWSEHLRAVAAPTLFWKSENWYIGANVEGKPRAMMLYLGGFGAYKEFTRNVASDGYKGLCFSH